MTQCSALKPEGGRCKNFAAKGGEYCAAHDPAHKERRHRNAVKGGRSKGGGAELVELKREVRAVIGGVLNGKIDKGDASVALQGFNVLIRATELQKKVYEVDELAAELEEIKSANYGRAS